jgi:hypothetical protein
MADQCSRIKDYSPSGVGMEGRMQSAASTSLDLESRSIETTTKQHLSQQGHCIWLYHSHNVLKLLENHIKFATEGEAISKSE